MWFAAAKTAVGAFFPGKLYIYLIVALSLFGAGAYSAWQVQNWRQAKNKLVVAEKTIEAGVKQTNTDNTLTTERVKTVTVYKQGATKFIKETIYETAAAPDSVLCDAPAERVSNFAAAIDAANAAR